MTDTYSELPAELDALPIPRRVLTVGAHPDDAEFGAGATLSRWSDQGSQITICVITDGSKGSWDPDEDQDSLITRRVSEQDAAGRVMGSHRTIHLGFTDGELENTMQLRRQIAMEIRHARPDVVLSHDPWQRYQLHPDHRAAGFAAVDGVVAAREPLSYADSGVSAHRPSALLLWSADEPDHAEPINDDYFERKVAALLCHSSQSVTTMGNAQADPAERSRFVERLDIWHRSAGERFGIGPAETFKRLTP